MKYKDPMPYLETKCHDMNSTWSSQNLSSQNEEKETKNGVLASIKKAIDGHIKKVSTIQ